MSASPVETTQFVLDGLKPEQNLEQWFGCCQQADVNWDDLAVRAIVLGLAPQLFYAIQKRSLPLPPRALAKLAVTHAATAKRNEAIYKQLGEVVEASASWGIHPIALKGVHLAAAFYAEPALRPMNDIDLLFTVEELPVAEAMLADLGYGGKYKSPDMGAGVTKHTSTFRRTSVGAGATPNPYLSTDSDRTVEPHGSLEESWFGLQVDITPGVRERAKTAVLGTHPALVLASEDLLLHLCVHFCFHLIQGAPSMVQLVDLLVVLQADEMDWADFLQQVRQKQASSFALAALQLAAKLLDAPVPSWVIAELLEQTPRQMQRYVQNLSLSHILQRTQQRPLRTIWQRVQRGFQDRAETARWATDWHSWWQVWQTVLRPDRTDTGQQMLGF